MSPNPLKRPGLYKVMNMKDLIIDNYRVVCVSERAPETYNVIKIDHSSPEVNYVGNIKLRLGILEVRYPTFEGEVIYSTQPYGAVKANEFNKPYERNKFIQLAVEAIDRHIKNIELDKPQVSNKLEYTSVKNIDETEVKE